MLPLQRQCENVSFRLYSINILKGLVNPAVIHLKQNLVLGIRLPYGRAFKQQLISKGVKIYLLSRIQSPNVKFFVISKTLLVLHLYL